MAPAYKAICKKALERLSEGQSYSICSEITFANVPDKWKYLRKRVCIYFVDFYGKDATSTWWKPQRKNPRNRYTKKQQDERQTALLLFMHAFQDFVMEDLVILEMNRPDLMDQIMDSQHYLADYSKFRKERG